MFWKGFLRGLLSRVGSLLILTLVLFFLSQHMGIDPTVIMSETSTDEMRQEFLRRHGFDVAWPIQFVRYIFNLFQGEFGESTLTGMPVTEDILLSLPATIELATVSILLCACIATPIGLFYPKVTQWTTVLHSLPSFLVGPALLMLFYVSLGWLPGPGRIDPLLEALPEANGFVIFKALFSGDFAFLKEAVGRIILPASTLAITRISVLARVTQSLLKQQSKMAYYFFARAKGLSENAIIRQHAWPNIRSSYIASVVASYLSLLEGAIIVETIFSWPGIGNYLAQALLAADKYAIIGATLSVAITVTLCNMLADFLIEWLDPRIRHGRA